MADRIGLFLEPSNLKAQPGGGVEAVLTVENRSAIVDQYGLSLDGLDAGWYSLSSGVAGLFPGEKAQVQVSFHPPQTSDVHAGTFPFSIKASSMSNTEEYSVVDGFLEVLPFGTSTLEMSPERLEGRRGVTNLLFRNPGNAPTFLSLQATDLEEGLNYKFSADTLTLPAGSERTLSLTIWPKRRPLFGEPHEHPFKVVALEPEQVPEEAGLTAEGAFTYQPRFAGLPKALSAAWRRTRPILPLVLSLAALALAVFAFLRPPPTVKPSEPPVPPPVIQSFSSEAGPDGSVRLKWQVQGAQQVRIDGSEVDRQQGSRPIERPETKEHVLEASNEGGTVRQRLGIVVLKPPTIVSFEVQPPVVERGGVITLAWKVENATKLSVDGTPVSQRDVASGKQEIRPDQTRDYIVVAENDVGWVVRRVTVQVR